MKVICSAARSTCSVCVHGKLHDRIETCTHDYSKEGVYYNFCGKHGCEVPCPEGCLKLFDEAEV